MPGTMSRDILAFEAATVCDEFPRGSKSPYFYGRPVTLPPLAYEILRIQGERLVCVSRNCFGKSS